jgi:hypothetical protein
MLARECPRLLPVYGARQRRNVPPDGHPPAANRRRRDRGFGGRRREPWVTIGPGPPAVCATRAVPAPPASIARRRRGGHERARSWGLWPASTVSAPTHANRLNAFVAGDAGAIGEVLLGPLGEPALDDASLPSARGGRHEAGLGPAENRGAGHAACLRPGLLSAHLPAARPRHVGVALTRSSNGASAMTAATGRR